MGKRSGVIGVPVIGCALGAQARAAGTELSRFWLPPQAGPKTVGDIEGQPESVPEFTVN
jgi:hypothetical protein